MIVPTGSCRVATRIMGPVISGAAAARACGAEAPRIIWLTPNAAPIAMTSAPTISIIFRVSMTILRPPAPTRDGSAYPQVDPINRSEEHTSELQSLMRISYAVFCLKKETQNNTNNYNNNNDRIESYNQ